ncbi:hypothetical protein ID866_6991 [Astraeus odoratus]|nr:hypothetical protein ID866_6991 [Astraeus odoratus]
MRYVSLSLAHLMHADMPVQLSLIWTFESTCWHFLASAAATTTSQHPCWPSHSQYIHFIVPSQSFTSVLPLLLLTILLPFPPSIFLPFSPSNACVLFLLPLNMPLFYFPYLLIMYHVHASAFFLGLHITH